MTWGDSLALGWPALVGAPWAATSLRPLGGTQLSNVYPPGLRFAVLGSGDKKRGQ